MFYLLAGAEAFFALGLLGGQLWQGEFLAAGGEKLGDVADGVVSRTGRLHDRGASFVASVPAGGLVFVFVGVVGGAIVISHGFRGRGRPRHTGAAGTA